MRGIVCSASVISPLRQLEFPSVWSDFSAFLGEGEMEGGLGRLEFRPPQKRSPDLVVNLSRLPGYSTGALALDCFADSRR